MFVIPQQQLQRVIPGRQTDFRLGLGAAEMHMVQVARDLAIERGKRGIDQQVMMSAIGDVGPSGRELHAGETEFHSHLAPNGGAIHRLD